MRRTSRRVLRRHGGHANKASGMRLSDPAGSAGRRVGVYGGAQLEGVVSSAGQRLQVQHADIDLKVSGRVDAHAVPRGASVELPAR